MALAPFRISPSSAFASSPTAAADLQLMRGYVLDKGKERPPPSSAAPRNQVTVQDLRSAIRERSERHRACFVAVLDRCYARIRRCASVSASRPSRSLDPKPLQCTFDVPRFIPGFPLYDVDKCLRFVSSHLTRSGFRVERAAEGEAEAADSSTIVVSWSAEDPFDDPAPPPPRRPIPSPRQQQHPQNHHPQNQHHPQHQSAWGREGTAFAPLLSGVPPPGHPGHPGGDHSGGAFLLPPPVESRPHSRPPPPPVVVVPPPVRLRSISEFRPDPRFVLNGAADKNARRG